MRKSIKLLAVFALAVPLSAVGVSEAQAQNTPKKMILDLKPTQIRSAQQINPTTVEVVFADDTKKTFDFYGDNIFRLFQDPEGGIIRNPQATPPAEILVKNPRKRVLSLQVEKKDGNVTISTADIVLAISGKTGLMSVVDKETGKTVIRETAKAVFDKGKVSLSLKENDGEYFYGGGVQNGRFSHKGKAIAIENTNNWVDGGVASPTPFYWSTAGYGVMWHTFKPGVYDFGAEDKGAVALTHEESYLDVFFMVNAGPVALLNDFYQLTGNPVLLPKFGFYQGHLNAYNRDYWTPAENGFMLYEDGKRYNESQKDNGGIKESLNGELPGNYQFSARAAIDRYLNNDMPLGWFLPNDGYGAGYGQTETLDGNIRNLKEFGDYARSKGVEIGLWTQSDLHPKEGIEALLQRDIVKEVRDAGVRVLKTDVAWVGAGYSFGLNGVADVGEIMPYYGSNARPFIISLDGWAGTQRYAGIWSGDQTGGDWEYIRFHIPTFIGSGLSGQPNISSDTDGIFGGKNLPVNVREFQWKTFGPMELNMDGWGANPKYPEALGEPATSINRSYLKLKAMLMPYAYTIAREAVDGKPMIRAMFLDYPNDYTLSSATQYQFLYGPSFLVAPIYQDTKMDKDGNDVRNGIYLPEGKWIDYYSGDVYEGGRIINNYPAPLWKLPVFVKAGSIIPMTKPHNTPAEVDPMYRIYEVYADGKTSFEEYDDDGKTQAYLDGMCAATKIESEVKGAKLTVKIGKTEGFYTGFYPTKETELRINASVAPKKVTAKVGGKKIALRKVSSREELTKHVDAYYYDKAPNLNCFATKGSEFAKVRIVKNPQIIVHLSGFDVQANDCEVVVDGFAYAPESHLLKSTGALSAPKVAFADDKVEAYTLTPAWEAVPNADYYEIEFEGRLYSTITDKELLFETLTPETHYDFKVRAVNADGASAWTGISATTKSDPLEFAIKGITAATSCENQGGQDVSKLFDYDEKSMWHTAWSGSAVPFDMIVDLKSVSELEKIVYLPREDAGNGTLLKGTYSLSTDKQTWTASVDFAFDKNGEVKTLPITGKARYIKFSITEGVGNFGSGREMYIFKVPGTESLLQGDINRDKRIDDNDLTSYMNYTGLRKGDGDFDYVSIGDINGNGLIDAYDISVVSTQLEGGVSETSDTVAGMLELVPSMDVYKAGDIVEVKVMGKGLHIVNALSFALPYDMQEFEYAGLDLVGMKEMVNLTYDRLHTNGTKALYPTFVNKGNNSLLEEGDHHLFTIKLKAKKAGKFGLKAIDGMLIDRSLGVASF